MTTKQNILDQYKTSSAKLDEILTAFEIDLNTQEFSPEQLQLIERVMCLVKQQKKTYSKAIDMVKNNQDSTSEPQEQEEIAIPPELTALINQQVETVAQRFKDETPHFIKQQQNLVREYIVRRFWQRMNEMVASGEMQAAFDRVLGSDQVYEAQILPGEPSALLESSSSGT